MTRVLIAGVSTRAAADSAARAGFDVTAIDAYADRDQHPLVRAVAVPRGPDRPFSAARAAALAASIDVDAAAYLSNFENDPVAVGRLGNGRALWGNAPGVLRQVRDPFVVATTFRERGLPVPQIHPHSWRPDSDATVRSWLVKPFSSGGGHGVRHWTPGDALPARCYLQERIDGTPASVVFVAAAGRAVPLGMSRQIIGDPRFGSSAYRYCGSILAPAADPQFTGGEALASAARALAQIAASAFAVTGLNGIDFIARDDLACPIEINPRWSSSMELVERAHGLNLFGAHAGACADGVLPDPPPQVARAVGKAIVFARQAMVAMDTDAWLGNPDIRDVPRPGDCFAPGEPVCTVFASAPDATRCYERLVACAEHVYGMLVPRGVRAAHTDSDAPFTSHE